ncbi:phosphatidylinositol 4,5-bisphosphate 5-phosphatase A [Spea bombifrons]|uniref:phosphatidylinositol 4,5-bisphosphate 5-phosphatase A n=1 Tax=Spea bombifrons TaxID=233779 RepID=UPI00234B16DE|nr:phosphatidylinositol 4,5-bisphosphate 5-phosphatase A [Spea bombifrons]XP_053324522.1 phosphatidylinositol 4,5-bisphosphate 5-phosphatase A [Spea bombifrons]
MEEQRDREHSSTHRAQNVESRQRQMDSNSYGVEQCVFVAPPSPEPPSRPTSLTSPRLSPAGSGRSQPEGSSGSQTPLPVMQLSIRPMSPVGSSAPDRSQPEGSQRIHPVGSPLNPRMESGRSQPEGFCSGLLSPTQQYRPIPPPPSSPHRSPAPSPRESPERRRSLHTSTPTKPQEPLQMPDPCRLAQEETERSPFNRLAAGSDQEKPGENFRIYVITWNVGCSVPPDDLTSLLCLNAGDGKTDMFVIGLQEVNSMINKRLKDALFSDQWSEAFMDVLSPFSYVLVSTVRMQGCLLLVFAKYFHLPFLRDVQTDCTRTGLGGYWGNKGGVSIRMALFGHMVCFLNCHLPAHMENSDQRVDNFESILQLQQFQGPLANGVLDHDLVFWFGDLNFRIEDLDLHFVKSAIQGNKFALLWEKDQLNMAKYFEPVLSGFMEGPLTFPPTYKFDVGTNTYDTSSKKRKPAWTDRILWKIKFPISQNTGESAGIISSESEDLSVTLLSYGSHMQYTESDHKPVSAIFSMQFSTSHVAPLVHLLVRDEWLHPEDACATYRCSPIYMKSSWDWIGLYKVGFRHHKDYVSYVWAKSEEDIDGERHQHQVIFCEESLPKGTGEYLLGYYSNNLGTLIGVTEPFQIALPGSEASTPSDSSDSSSEEDNSTQVLLRPKSRSPSPAAARSPRSRSPALARLHDLILPGSSRQKSRSPSPHGAKSPRQERSQRPRSRELARDNKGTKEHSSHHSQYISIPTPRPAVEGQGYNPKEATVLLPNSPSQMAKLHITAPSQHPE